MYSESRSRRRLLERVLCLPRLDAGDRDANAPPRVPLRVGVVGGFVTKVFLESEGQRTWKESTSTPSVLYQSFSDRRAK